MNILHKLFLSSNVILIQSACYDRLIKLFARSTGIIGLEHSSAFFARLQKKMKSFTKPNIPYLLGITTIEIETQEDEFRVVVSENDSHSPGM